MIYATLREALYDFFLHTMPHLFPTAVIIVVKMSSPHCRMQKEGGILMRLPCPQNESIRQFPSSHQFHRFHHLMGTKEKIESGQALFTTLKLRSEGLAPSSVAQSAPPNSTCGSSTARLIPLRQGALVRDSRTFRAVVLLAPLTSFPLKLLIQELPPLLETSLSSSAGLHPVALASPSSWT